MAYCDDAITTALCLVVVVVAPTAPGVERKDHNNSASSPGWGCSGGDGSPDSEIKQTGLFDLYFSRMRHRRLLLSVTFSSFIKKNVKKFVLFLIHLFLIRCIYKL